MAISAVSLGILFLCVEDSAQQTERGSIIRLTLQNAVQGLLGGGQVTALEGCNGVAELV